MPYDSCVPCSREPPNTCVSMENLIILRCPEARRSIFWWVFGKSENLNFGDILSSRELRIHLKSFPGASEHLQIASRSILVNVHIRAYLLEVIHWWWNVKNDDSTWIRDSACTQRRKLAGSSRFGKLKLSMRLNFFYSFERKWKFHPKTSFFLKPNTSSPPTPYYSQSLYTLRVIFQQRFSKSSPFACKNFYI